MSSDLRSESICDNFFICLADFIWIPKNPFRFFSSLLKSKATQATKSVAWKTNTAKIPTAQNRQKDCKAGSF